MPKVDLELKYSSRSRPARPRHKLPVEEGQPALADGGEPVAREPVAVDTVDIEALQRRVEAMAQAEIAKDGRIEKLAVQFHDAQQDLELQKRTRCEEVAETAIKLSQLEQQLGTVSDSLSGFRKAGRLAAMTAAGIVMVGVCVIFWRIWASERVQHDASINSTIADQRDPDSSRPLPIARGHLLHRTAGRPDKVPPEPGAAFTAALDRLDDAIDQFPGRSPEELLRLASDPKAGCLLQWNDRRPSVLFGDPKTGPTSLTSTLFHCAEAISSLPSTQARK
jgi:hypothetical protein